MPRGTDTKHKETQRKLCRKHGMANFEKQSEFGRKYPNFAEQSAAVFECLRWQCGWSVVDWPKLNGAVGAARQI